MHTVSPYNYADLNRLLPDIDAIPTEAYATAIEANAYFNARANTIWSGLSTPTKNALLVKATDYIDEHYAFIGIRAACDQPREWPRLYVYDQCSEQITVVPPILKQATIEVALMLNNGDLALGQQAAGGEEFEIGSVRYKSGGGGAGASSIPVHTGSNRISRMLSPVATPKFGFGEVRVNRA